MSANPHWEVSLVRSLDMNPIGPSLLKHPFTLTPVFDRAGSFQMTLPLDDEMAYKIAKHATGVSCERNDAVKWSGENVSVAKDPTAMTMTITALGWLDQLNHRFVYPSDESSLTFSGTRGGDIARALVSSANARLDSGGNPRPTAVTFGSAYDVQVRTRSYSRGQSYGQALQELSDVEDGFDMVVDPTTRTLLTFAPDSYRDLRNVVFGYGVEPFNLANAPMTDDGTDTAERVVAVGSNNVLVIADDPAAIDAQGFMREQWLSLSDVADPTIVGAYANAEMVYSRYGKQTYDLSPLAYGDVPRLYDDFELGDQVYLSVSAGAHQVELQPIRIFSVTLSVDANGNETVTQIATAPQ